MKLHLRWSASSPEPPTALQNKCDVECMLTLMVRYHQNSRAIIINPAPQLTTLLATSFGSLLLSYISTILLNFPLEEESGVIYFKDWEGE
jgi:hypothetical protein